MELNAWSVGDIAAASFQYRPMELEAPKAIASNFEEQVLVRVIRQGHLKVECSGTSRVFGPGSIFLMNTRNKLTALDEGASFSFRLPFNHVAYDPYQHGSLVPIETQNWMGRVLQLAIDSLFERLPKMSMQEAQMVVPQMSGMIRALLGKDAKTDLAQCAIVRSRSLAMRRFVDQNLHRPDLGVGALRTEFNASRATVYRAFDEVGGVAAYIRDQRLEGVHRALHTATPARGAIRQIAEAQGFWDQKTFLRAFRKRFGVRPSEVIGTGKIARVCLPPPAPKRLGVRSLASFWGTPSLATRQAS
jgi:AraC-like DNA-binding protein